MNENKELLIDSVFAVFCLVFLTAMCLLAAEWCRVVSMLIRGGV